MLDKDNQKNILKLIIEYEKKYSNATIAEKFELLNLIIQLENKSRRKKASIYKNIKVWMNLYIETIENKQFSYDEIIFDKVKEKLVYLPKEEQYSLLNYFIRLLKKKAMDEAIIEYHIYRKQLKMEILLEKEKYFEYLYTVSTNNLKNLFITLSLSVLLFSLFWYFLDICIPSIMNIELKNYIDIAYFNYILNFIGLIFGIGQKLAITSIGDFIYVAVGKVYFFIFITYFLLKKLSEKLER